MTTHEMPVRAQQQWPTFSSCAPSNPFYGGYFNPAEQMNQLQQSVKRLEEQLVASNSKQSSNQVVTGQESSNRRADKSRAHNISENETGLSDISSEEESCSNGNDSDAEIDGRGNPIPSTSAVSFKNLMDNAKKQSPQVSKLDKLDQLSQDFEEKKALARKLMIN